jgi:hypothetical protein
VLSCAEQTDTAEHIDWQTRTITYFRMKTGSRAQFAVSKSLERVLQQLPTVGPLFPKLSTFSESDRASRFRRRCDREGVSGVTLHMGVGICGFLQITISVFRR